MVRLEGEVNWVRKLTEDGKELWVHKEDSSRFRMEPPPPSSEDSIEDKIARLERIQLMLLSRTPKITRERQILKEKITLHKETPEYCFPIENVPPSTFGMILGVYNSQWDNGATHSYLDFTAYQKGYEADPTRRFTSPRTTHYNHYANTDYYEVIIPWSCKETDTDFLVFQVALSYNTSVKNHYDIECRGFLSYC